MAFSSKMYNRLIRWGVVGVSSFVSFELGYFYRTKQDDLQSRNIATYGLPQGETQIIPYDSYLLCYDHAKRVPIWVGERLNSEITQGTAERKHLNFTVEQRIPSAFASKNEDYWKSGWTRGHMAAAGNYKRSEKEMKQTFFLSNVVPQDYQNNAGYWNLMEIYARDLTKKFQDVYVYSGPLFLPTKDESSGKEFVKYQVIGQDKVAVPTHLYKVIVARNPNQIPALGVFVVPNRSVPFGDPLQKYEVKLETLEQQVGVQFVPKLKRNVARNLCEIDGCKLMDVREFTIMYLTRQMKDVKTMKQLEKDWLAVKHKGLENEPEMKSFYEMKRTEILKNEAEKVKA